MFAKNSKAANVLVVSLIVMAVAVSSYRSRRHPVASASELPTPHSAPTKPTEAAVTPQIEPQQPLTATQNGITVEITSAQVINTGVEIGICYTTLDGGEWYPMPGHLFYDEYEIFPDEIQFLNNEILADGNHTGTRCALIRYRIDDLDTVTAPLTFSILQFYAPGREMYSPCEELQQRLATNSQAQAYGLKAKCEENADGSTKVTLLESNKTVTTKEAQKALNSIASAEISGNWELKITDIQN